MKKSDFIDFSKNMKLILEAFNEREEHQTKCLDLMREIVKRAGKIITVLHVDPSKVNTLEIQKEFNEIENQIKELKSLIDKIKWFQSFLIISEQEYCEAYLFYVFLKEQRVCIYDDLPIKISYDSYFYGLCDFTGELKRFSLNSLLKNDYKTAELCVNTIEKVFNEVSLFKFSDSVVPELRKKIDTMRVNLDHAKSELFMYKMRIKDSKE
ncbi:MAG: hypothetical protein N3E37_03000 [Candidatus Micrarchaeota archaeon]|nr:hypothetical protein [Candidatus Micrarchaeota archaeon]